MASQENTVMHFDEGFFQHVFGFPEKDYETTRKKLLDLATFEAMPYANFPREKCDFTVNGETITAGIFSMPSVEELQKEVEMSATSSSNKKGRIQIQNIAGESRMLHQQFPGSIIQAASQFNLLEFPAPEITPEEGIEGYIYDSTQGPACAIACTAGTAYRNYLVPVPDQDNNNTPTRGQTEKNQLDGLAELETFLLNEYPDAIKTPPWKTINGYVESSTSRIKPLNNLLKKKPELAKKLESLLRIGVQEDTTITDVSTWQETCTQVYSSAISIGYSRLPNAAWKLLAKIVLNATYHATLLVGVLKAVEAGETTTPPILLTKVGGGVFRNKDEWIMEAISNAATAVANQYPAIDLDIRIVHYGSVDPAYQHLESIQSPQSSSEEL